MAQRSRVAGFLTALVFATALPVALAAPASADSGDCYLYLKDNYFGIRSVHRDACVDGERGYFDDCVDTLRDFGIRHRHAVRACEWAER
ncbi:MULTISPECIES: hypothetical protein [unclassified Crossiella]|uniref:hypothetical protein n=1 Tax=unclassified Crossiella TaxID=2620835 RepID=UPI001FFF0E92|nr:MULTISPECIES: hypothetical protein [unclassified Crossiella]MCK2240712.1 hypothetical protein [Crossiella sp. S99.2]MCK2252837.1 hypothetical protein [Crossiella sp. S99.1]